MLQTRVAPGRCSLGVSSPPGASGRKSGTRLPAMLAGGCALAATYCTGSSPNVARVFWNL